MEAMGGVNENGGAAARLSGRGKNVPFRKLSVRKYGHPDADWLMIPEPRS